ncbi:uncharacterized protein [Diadema setosum]|uniref:uncharacterized protein n=1 Tax=Diadema setosum TaxID=31175 RepID=UPI003B3B963F
MDYSTRHFLLALLTALMVYLSNSLVLEVYKFYEGRNVSLEFHQPLSSDSTPEFEFYLIRHHDACNFFKNGSIVRGCLTPQQSRRFSIESKRMPTNLTVTLSIYNISMTDSQGYLLCVLGDRNGKRYVDNHIAFINVQHPPGPVECTVQPTENSAVWTEVNCTSRLGSDGEGSLFCFQDEEKASLKESSVRVNDHVAQIFWMNVCLPISCCAYEETFPLTSGSCSQFVYHPPASL